MRTWLYVPADRAERITKALESDADAVILDLEDAVAPDAKDTARHHVRTTLAAGHHVHVRVNALDGPHATDDIAVLASADTAPAGVRIPKCEDPNELARAADRLKVAVHPILESALGVEHAYAIATAHPLVAGISLGEADLAADLRTTASDALAWPRSRVVVAARAAGLPSPAQSVWTAVRNLDGLRADTEQGRRAGFFGRSVIHPTQIPVVHEACRPDAEDVAWARSLVNTVRETGDAAWVDSTGRFVDKAVMERAQWLLATADEDPNVKEGQTS